jgi:transposase-like protein
VDEPYIKVKGQWVYLYRAVDQEGQTVDFYLSEHRDIEAAKAFFRKAILHNGVPAKITLDGYQASHRAVEGLQQEKVVPAETVIRSCPYLNNIVEQDHRGVKSRTAPMLAFKRFDHATIVIAGIELARRIKKGQFNVHRLMKRAGDIHDMWMAVLVA